MARLHGHGSRFSNVNFAPNEEVNYTITTSYYLDGTLANVDEPFAINYSIFRRKNIGIFPTIESIGKQQKMKNGNDAISNQIYYNKHIVNEANSFLKNLEKIQKEANINANNCQVGITFYLPYKIHTSFDYIYFDDINVERKKQLSNDKVSIRELSVKKFKTIYKRICSWIEYKFFFDFDQEMFFEYNPPNLGPGRPNECITQQKINDFRTHVTRYEGTFYNNNVVPYHWQTKFG